MLGEKIDLSPPSRPLSPERLVTLKRLLDVVALPSSRVGAQDRAIAGDLLLELLIDANVESKTFCARRLRRMPETPRRVLYFLASGEPEVAEIILEDNIGLDQSDLRAIALSGHDYHRRLIACRRDAGPCVADAIVDSNDVEAMEQLLLNHNAEISEYAAERMVNVSRVQPKLAPLLLKRSEIRPAQALIMFWWSPPGTRRDILLRFAADREVLIEACSDIFIQARNEQWKDPMVQKALHVLERRQRNRHALDKSPFASLEEAVNAARRQGLSREMVEEISALAGISSLTGAKIMADAGGEGTAVLCKATGLKRKFFATLWAAMKRPLGQNGALDPEFARVLEIYDMMAIAKAQTVLRYWNWSFSAALSPELLSMDGADAPQLGDGDFSPAIRAARLVFGR